MEKIKITEAEMAGKKEGRKREVSDPKTRHMHPDVERMLNDLSKEELVRRAVDREVGEHYLAWFHAFRRLLRSVIENPKFQDPGLMREIEFFLTQTEHHFTPSGASREIRNAFRHLHQYFRFYPCMRVRHSRWALAMLRRIEEARSEDTLAAGGEVRAWFGNRIWVILRTIESPKFMRTMEDIKFFMKTLGEFFIETKTSRYYRNAFRYLRRYFRVYPLVRKRESERAIEMIGRIYQGLGYEFKYQAHVKPGVLEVRESVLDGTGSRTQGVGEALVPAAA